MTDINALFRSPLLNESLNPGNGSFVLVEWAAEPSPASSAREEIAPYHVHHADDEAWYVLEGTLGFRFDGEEFEVPAGGAAYARAGVAHTYWNASSVPARYLLVMSPQISELITARHDPARAGQSLDETFREFQSELVGEAPSLA
jgi:hypothetical protein